MWGVTVLAGWSGGVWAEVTTQRAAGVGEGAEDVSAVVEGVRRAVRGGGEVPGLWGAVVTADGLVAVGAGGVRKMGETVPALVGDEVHLGSCTKSMTAAMVAMAVERKELAYESTLGELFPELREKMHKGYAGVTLRQLLDHKAGLPGGVTWWAGWTEPLAEQRRKLVEQVLTSAPAGAVGTFGYSNVGYAVLGAALEARSKRPWEQILKEELFVPLGMTSAGFGPPGRLGTTDEPWGHVWDGGKLRPMQWDNPPAMGPAGTVHCSMEDWGKFVAWCLRAEARGTKELPREGWLRLTAGGEAEGVGVGDEYVGGWGVTSREWAGGRTLHNAGSNTTWYCAVWMAPKRGFALMVATNVMGDAAPGVCDTLVGALIA